MRSFVTERVTRIIKSPEFADAWVAANREAHTQLVAVLTGEGTDTVNVTGNTVSLNLAVVIDTVKAQLVNAGFELADRIPEVNAQFTIFESADLAKAQNGFRLLEKVARVLPFIALLLLGIAVYVARSRRRALVAAGWPWLVRCSCSAPRSTSSGRSTSMPSPPTSCRRTRLQASTTRSSSSSGSTCVRCSWSSSPSPRAPG